MGYTRRLQLRIISDNLQRKVDLKCNLGSLTLNTRNPKNTPLLIDLKGGSRTIDFVLDEETESHGSCSLVFKNEFYILGGFKFKNQISKVSECKLKRTASLPFDFTYGACTNVNGIGGAFRKSHNYSQNL